MSALFIFKKNQIPMPMEAYSQKWAWSSKSEVINFMNLHSEYSDPFL